MKNLTLFLLVFFALTLAGCRSKEENPQTSPVHAPAISISISRKNCPSVEIAKGSWIEWTNTDSVRLSVQIEHDAANNTTSVTTATELDPGKQFSFQMTEAGTFRYYCTTDRAVYATIIVK
jgi:plastocyanin